MALKTFKAEADLKKGFKVETRSRGHKVILDEPEAMGGNNEGMNPVELSLCSLGGCLAITAATFADSCNVELNDFSVEVEGDIDPGGFQGTKDVEPGFQEVRFKIHIDSDSPEENIEKLIEIVKTQCPVSDSLTRNIEIEEEYKIT